MQSRSNPSSEFPLSSDAVSLVLDLLDTPSIASFCRVNRSCCILARPSLWKNLRIPDETTLARLAGLETTDTSSDRSQTTTPSPWLTMVRSLEIAYNVWSADNTDWHALWTLIEEVKDNLRQISLAGPAIVDQIPQLLKTVQSQQARAFNCLFGTGTSYPHLKDVNFEAVWPRLEKLTPSEQAWVVDHSRHVSPPEHAFWRCAAPSLRQFAVGLSHSLEFVRPIVEQHTTTLESLSVCLYDESWPADMDAMAKLRLPRLRNLSWSFSKLSSPLTPYLMQTIGSHHQVPHGGLTRLLDSRSLRRTLTTLEVQSSGSLRTLLIAISHCRLLTKLSLSPGPLAFPSNLFLEYKSEDWGPLLTSPLPHLTHLCLVKVTHQRDPNFALIGQMHLTAADPTNDGLIQFLHQAAPNLVELKLDGCPALFPQTQYQSGQRRTVGIDVQPPKPHILDTLLGQLTPSIERLVLTHPLIRTAHDNKFPLARSRFRQVIRQFTLDLPPRSTISLLPLLAPNLEELDIPVARVDLADLDVLRAAARLRRLVVGGSGDYGSWCMWGKMEWRKERGEWTMVEGDDIEIDDA
ncbi:hypothetical protein M427DRAFT_356304 [Gonapodya prolifera JEL478]|uniref:F-box domain-containing protein n=1 Tax=Gonapodya prolifera (strain JEL478) TaxID=1344416 RepID=A0A139AB79_GONPJ|nr:hypothetical protein M427DRAFT_356304 [Gonapodya prolifera JEL478]|eukprot:KXS13968.1 hypothetical protein M427DRAFT_356304 [Gonapodya prolifera JEL478]